MFSLYNATLIYIYESANVWPILNQLEGTATPHSGQLT